ncbi:MAG: Na+/H+ antiporter NhaA [Gammaproteobacteria bacterium]
MPLKRTYGAVAAFFKLELAGGAMLFAAALAAMFAANAPGAREWYAHFLHMPVGVIFGEAQNALPLSHVVNDGLMAVFFFLVGLEIKRELLVGELSSRARALLPAAAAAGGMLGPAVIYAGFNWGDDTAIRGWAIPTATDIAFSLGVLSLLGRRAPFSLKIFLLAIAVIDDLGAIAIIALFYAGELSAAPLLLSAAFLFLMFMMNHYNVCSRVPYILLGFALWSCVVQSGVHATLAGVATAFAVPLRVPEGKKSPLVPLEHDLHVLVTFFILPLFAFANAGVSFAGLSAGDLLRPLPLGIMAGLIAGKAVGITGASWLAVRAGIAELPRGCSWVTVGSLSLLCGIGFTVSLFIGNLAFAADNAELVNFVKLGVLTGSALAGMGGYLLLRFVALNGAKNYEE